MNNYIPYLKKHKKKIIIGVSILVFILIFFIFALPPIIRPIAEKQLTIALERAVKIGKIHLNPLFLSVQVDSFSMQEKNSNERFASFDRLYINMQLMSIFRMGLVAKELEIDNPVIHVQRNLDSTYNFDDLLKPKKKKDTTELKFSLNNIRIKGGYITFSDLPKNAHHEIKNLEISLPFISNLDYYTNIYCTPSFSAIINGTPIELKGKTKPFDKTMETEIAIKFDQINLAKYLEYVPEKLNFKLNSALLSSDGQLHFLMKDKKPSFEYRGKISLDSINLTDKNDSLILNLPFLKVDVNSAEIVSSSINLRSIAIKSPVLNLSRERNGKISLLNLLPQAKASESKPSSKNEKQQSTPFHFKLDHFTMEQGKVIFTDKIFSHPFKDEIDSINFCVNNLNIDQGCQYAFDLVNRSVEKINSKGNLVFKPMTANGKIRISGLKPKYYSSYFPADFDIDLKNGVVDFETEYNIKNSDNNNEISISNGILNVKDLDIWQRSVKEEIFRNKRITLSGLSFNLFQNTLSIDSVLTENASINLKRLSDSTINFAALTGTTKKKNLDSSKVSNKKTILKPLIYAIKNIRVNNYNILFEDQSTLDKTTFEINKVNLYLANLSNRKNSKAQLKLNAALKPNGYLSVAGALSMEPLSSTINVNLRNVPLKPIQGYISDQLNITLTGGQLTTSGSLIFAQNTNSTMNANYKGNVEVDDFSTISKENADNFLLLKSLQLSNMNFSLVPFKLDIKDVRVNELNTIFNIYADGTTNLQQIMKKDTSNKEVKENKIDTPAVSLEKPEDKKDIRIGTVALNNCNINFSDHRFKNIFNANMKNLNGTITGLSSEQNIMADVAVNGKYDATSPITISGKVNPLAKNLYVDIGLNFKDIDLTQMNPYSQKYLGYAIRKGKLSLDLKYLVKDKKLDSKNNIYMDQLTLGEAVESPDATHLPVRFALALLRDRNGDINLNVPVTGSIDDPKFNIGKLVLQVLGNIITKAITSPFSALGAIFGGKEELSYLEFEPGSSEFSSQSIEKLEKISNGLKIKKELNVEIQGFSDLNNDRDGLKKYLFQHKLKAAKLKDLLKHSEKNITIDSITIQTDEYEKYLKKAYEAEHFEKPRTKLGFTKLLPVSEMENLILKNIVVNDNDLKMLANTRALKVKEYLVNDKKISAERVFLVEAKKISPEAKPDVKDSRIEFVLKAN